MPLSTTIVRLLFIVALFGALCNSNFFGPNTLTAYFLYVIPASILAVIMGLSFVKQKRKGFINHSMPLILLFLLTLYYFLSGFLHKDDGSINLRHYFLLANFCWLVGLCIALLYETINLRFTGYVLLSTIIVEVIVLLITIFSSNWQ